MDNWFNFETTGNGVNPKDFQVTGKYPSGNIPLTANPNSIPNNGGESTITSGTIKYNDGTTVDDGTLIEVETTLGTVSPIGNNVLFSDDMESGQNGWTATGFWHLVQQGVSPYPEAHSPTHSWWYGQDATGNYYNGQTNSGTLISPSINLTSAATLSFWRWEETEGGSYYDSRKVYISTNNGSSWTQIYQSTGQNQKTWVKESINLSSYTGTIVKIKFEFDTKDNLYNNYQGWYIDDVRIEVGGSNASLACVGSISNKNKQDKETLGNKQLNVQRQNSAEKLKAVEMAAINKNVTLTGLQIPTSGGIIQFKLISGTGTGTATVTAHSVEGDAQGQVNVTIIGDNLALNRPVAVSSTYSSSYPGSNAVDGSSSTYWRSENGTSSDHFEWIYVNLGSQYNVNKVVLDWRSSYFSIYYTIQTWNGSQWIVQETITNGSGGIETLQFSTPAMTQYIAVGCEQPNSSTYSYAIDEFEVYATGSNQFANATSPFTIKEPTHPIIQSDKLVVNAKVKVRNFPNPFNPETQICFSLSEPCFVELKVFNLRGQIVKNLLSNEMQAGNHNITWDGTDNELNKVAGGVYLYILKAGDFIAKRKMIIMK